MTAQAHGKTFEGRAPEMRDSPWLAAEDLDGFDDVTVEIEKVEEFRNVEFEKGRKKDRAFAVSFVKRRRKLVLNGTNRKAIQRMYGSNVLDWRGKLLTLYIDKQVKLAGKTVWGIRIRDKQGEAKAAKPSAPTGKSVDPDFLPDDYGNE